jgi:hypothetical protein
MALRIHFSGDDLARGRADTGPDPLRELVLSLAALQRRRPVDGPRVWSAQVRRQLRREVPSGQARGCASQVPARGGGARRAPYPDACRSGRQCGQRARASRSGAGSPVRVLGETRADSAIGA